jgi:hypothetical protein
MGTKRKHSEQITILTSEQLEKKNPHNLRRIYRQALAVVSCILNLKGYLCECCGEYVDGTEEDWFKLRRTSQFKAEPYQDYVKLIKSILDSKGHIPRTEPVLVEKKRWRHTSLRGRSA